MDTEAKDENNKWGKVLGQLGQWSRWVLRLIDLRFTVVIGLSAFLLAVSVDAPETYAKDSALKEAAIHASKPADHNWVTSKEKAQQQHNSAPEAPYSESDRAIAQHLSHNDLTHSVFTGSHLTRAHFFTHSLNGAP